MAAHNKLSSLEALQPQRSLRARFKVHTKNVDETSLEPPFLIKHPVFRFLFENNPHPSWIYDLHTLRFLAVNDAAVRNYRYSRKEFLSMTVEQIHPLVDTGLLTKLSGSEALGPSAPSVWRHRRKDGTVFDVEVISHSMMFGDREAQLVLSTDVTGRERAQEVLRESEERYRDLFDHSTDILFTTDLEGNFTSLNKAGESVTGYSAEEALKRNLGHLLGPKYLELARHMRERKMVEGGQTTYEIEIATKDGRLLTLAVSTSLIYKDGKPSGVRGIARDITERKQLEDRLRQSQKLEALGRLAGGIAHDFNNLLGIMVGYSEVLFDRLHSNDPLHGFANEILKAGGKAASLTRQLLAFGRRQVLKPKVLDLNASITDMEQLLRRLIREDIELIVKTAPQQGRVKVDPGQMEQVIMNLAVNARDAMPLGGTLTIETANEDLDETYARRYPYVVPGPYVLLAVSDTGTGMDEETQARIFEPFFTTKELGKGTGLGLATVYGIVKQSGGYIWVQSQIGKGTSFKLYFPRVEQPVADSGLDRRQIGPLIGTETILLVEDAEEFRKLTRMLLEANGYTVLEARTSSDAARLAARHEGRIDLLLTDVVMPQIDGYQLSDHLRFVRPEMKVLYMSGYAGPVGTHQIKTKPGATLLPKPFCKDTLLFMVRRVLDESRSDSEAKASACVSAGVSRDSGD
jgi:two-component system, cell cycle sensor histidine kinase and response regulator CckA